MKRASRIILRGLLVLAGLLTGMSGFADEFGDVSVEPSAIYTGETFHGYAETRVTLENHSRTKTHTVLLAGPSRSYVGGNGISRISRTVTLEPGAREIVSLLQPPLPAQGDSQINVEVDGRDEGDVHAPNANNHCNNYSRGGNLRPTVFISRSLDFDAVDKLFNGAGGSAFTAQKAVGPPDATGGGYQPNAWMPDTRRYNRTNWLELDYVPAQTVNKVVIVSPEPLPGLGSVLLIGVSGTNLASLSVASGMRSRRTGWEEEFSLPTTGEPVKTVCLEFGRLAPSSIAIDAVQISGPSGSAWAADARASSDNSASSRAYVSGGVTEDNVESLRAESPVSEWSENWLAYSPFDVVAVDASDLSTMSPAVLAALGDYVRMGGNIILAGKLDLPEAWRPMQNTGQRGDAGYPTGFGNCYVFGSDTPTAFDPALVEKLRGTMRETMRYWEGLPYDGNAANSVMPVVETLKIPTRGIVVIMLAFIIVIGPVNIIYLSRRKRRTWMLWTIPVISVVTTLIVFAYSLLREGITPDTRIAGLTLLDQRSHRAATIGCTAFYCPLTPSSGLQFDYETEATPLVQMGFGSGTAREIDWTQSQHLQRGWVSARVPSHFHIRKPETRRERVRVILENGQLTVENSLGVPIKSICVADADMNVYEAENVPAGQKAGLIKSGAQKPAAEKAGANSLWHDIGFAAPQAGLVPEKYLLPNTYVAQLEGNPFIENALGPAASSKRTKASAVVFGILDPIDMK